MLSSTACPNNSVKSRLVGKTLFQTLFFFLMVTQICFAQWVQTKGPCAGPATNIVVSGTNLFASILGGGVFLSGDNGTSWTAVNSGLDSLVDALVMNGSNLFAGTWYGGVFISTNNGTSWTQTTLDTIPISALAVSGTNLFAGMLWSGGVFLSTNNGEDWTAANTPFSGFSQMIEIEANLFAGTGSGVFLSTDSGTSWIQVNSGLTDTSINALAGDETNLFAGTGSGVYRSTNSGANWIQVNSGLTDAFVYTLASDGTNLFAGTASGVFLSTDNGSSWTTVNSEPIGTRVYSLGIFGSNLFAGTDCGIFVSLDQGSSWTGVGLIGYPNVHITALATRDGELFAGAKWGRTYGWPINATRKMWPPLSHYPGSCIFHSTDNGESWVPQMEGGALCFVINGTDVFAGNEGGVYRSTDNGSSWTQVNVGLTYTPVCALAFLGQNLFAGTASDRNLVWHLDGHGVFRSTNNGMSWTQTTLDTFAVLALTVSGSNIFAGVMYAGVFVSTDSGLSWTMANSGLTSNYILSLAVNSTNLFAGTCDSGVFRSTDNGSSWVAAGLSDKCVPSLVMLGTNLVANTSDGIFLSTDYGTSWQSIDSGLPSYEHNIFGPLAFTDEYVFFGTGHYWYSEIKGGGDVGVGVWRRPLSEIIIDVQNPLNTAPTEFALEQNFPNPFNPSTKISWQSPVGSWQTLKVYDVLGNAVLTLLNEYKPAGKYEVDFVANGLPSGVYFYQLKAGDFIQTKKMILIK
jgi:photosystem II stability/assembly factor-like uncharacterized protein